MMIKTLVGISVAFTIGAAVLSPDRSPPPPAQTSDTAVQSWTFAASDRVCGLSIHAQAEGSTQAMRYVDVAILAARGATLDDHPAKSVRVSLHTMLGNGPPSGSTSLSVYGDATPAFVANFRQDDEDKTVATSPELSDADFPALTKALLHARALTVTLADDRTYSVEFNSDDFYAKLMRWGACRARGES